MRLALDTNAYSALQSGKSPGLYSLVQQVEELYLPFVVIGELSAGFRLGSKAKENAQKLQAFTSSGVVDVLFADDDTINYYAEVWATLNKNGRPIPTNDVWIAALCLQFGCSLATGDKHFEQVPLLQTTELK